MSDPVAAWRTALGASAQLWAAGRHEVEPDRWLAFSGAKSVDYNAILCHGADAAPDLARSLADVKAAKVPAVIMVAGPALAMTNVLATAEWVCVGAQPLMVLTDIGGAPDADVRPLRPDELPAADAMLTAAYGVTPELAAVALPTVAAAEPARVVWGLFDAGTLVSCTGAVTVGDTIAIWSMATPPEHQRHGYGRRLLSAVLAAGREAGATTAVLYASPEGQPLYRALGFTIAEYWQVWSRPRWVFPPA